MKSKIIGFIGIIAIIFIVVFGFIFFDNNKEVTKVASETKVEDSQSSKEPDKTSSEKPEKEEDKEVDKDKETTEEDDNKETDLKEEIEKEEVSHEGQAQSFLTGEWVDEKIANERPIAVQINNIKAAMPQYGIGKASIIYETLAEGGITRFLAIFEDKDVEKIGSVRSARRYYIDFSLDHDAIYLHFGKDPSLYWVFKEINMAHMDGMGGFGYIYWDDPNRVRPHKTFTDGKSIMKGWANSGYRHNRKDTFQPMFQFLDENKPIEEGQVVEHMTIPYSNFSFYKQISEFKYDIDSKTYKRFQFGEPQVDALTDEQLSVKNILVQYADIHPRPGDTEGRRDITTISSGKGYYITEGTKKAITWEKKSQFEPTLWYNEDGTRLQMNTGKTWICVVPLNQDIIFE